MTTATGAQLVDSKGGVLKAKRVPPRPENNWVLEQSPSLSACSGETALLRLTRRRRKKDSNPRSPQEKRFCEQTSSCPPRGKIVSIERCLELARALPWSRGQYRRDPRLEMTEDDQQIHDGLCRSHRHPRPRSERNPGQ